MYLSIDQRPDPLIDNNMAIRCVLDILDGEGKFICTIKPEAYITYTKTVPIHHTGFDLGVLNGEGMTKEDFSNWKIRIRGDARLSLSEFDCRTYWAGSIEYNLADLAIY